MFNYETSYINNFFRGNLVVAIKELKVECKISNLYFFIYFHLNAHDRNI